MPQAVSSKRKSRRRTPPRGELVRVRVTEDELELWRSKASAAGVSVSVLLRQAMTRTRTWTAAAADVERERTRHVARLGSNLNQIARWANGHRSAADAVEVISHLVVIERELRGLARPGGEPES